MLALSPRALVRVARVRDQATRTVQHNCPRRSRVAGSVTDALVPILNV